MAGGEGDAALVVAAWGSVTYQVRLLAAPDFRVTAANPLTIEVSSDTAGVVATPATLPFTRENWFRSQTVTVSATASAAGTAELAHEGSGTTTDSQGYEQSNYDFEDYPLPKVTVRVLESDASRSHDPLTAGFEGLPEAHDGETVFTFRILFSEAVSVTPEAMRSRVLTVEGGAVTGATRGDGETGVWAIAVTPDTREALSISLPPAADCDADGAVCTSDGRALSIGAAHIVTGPADQPERNTAATGTPTISGTPQVGDELTASTSGIADADGLDNATFSYRWLVDDTAIQGATGSTYTLATADEGEAIKVQVSFTDDAGNEETLTSAATGAVATKPNSPATGAPTISGATDSTYTLSDSGEGKAIKVRVSFTDDEGNEETLTSRATEAVAAAEPTEPPAAPTNLTSVVNDDGTVTLGWDAPDDDSVAGYQILRRRPTMGEAKLLVYVADTGGTAITFTDTEVTASTRHVYRVKAINAAGLGKWSNYVRVEP